MDAPDLDFEYADSDSYFHEISELYSYSEVPEFETTKDFFETSLVKHYRTTDWFSLFESQKRDYVLTLLDQFELIKLQDRTAAVKSLLYLAHGNYTPGMDETSL